MDARRVSFVVIGIVLIAAAAWLRGAGIAGAAWIRAAFDAMPQAEGTALIDHVNAANDGRLVLAQGLPTLVASARDDRERVVTKDSLVLATAVQRYEEKTERSNGETRTTRSWESTSG